MIDETTTVVEEMEQPIQEVPVLEPLQAATKPTPKPATKKPAFKRVATAQPTKTPSFKRVKPAAEVSIQAEATASQNTTIVAPNSPASPSVVVQAPPPAPMPKEAPKAIIAQVEGSKFNNAEIASLIEIRNYIGALLAGNYNIEKTKIHDLQKISLLLDRKIVDALVGSEFKAFVNFADAQSAVNAAARQNNIRSSLYG